MVTKQFILDTLAHEFPRLKKDYNVRRIGLFGSYTGDGATEQSDIDLIIEFGEPIGLRFIDLCDYIERIFNKKVDILTPEGLKSIRIESIRDNILKTVEYVDAA